MKNALRGTEEYVTIIGGLSYEVRTITLAIRGNSPMHRLAVHLTPRVSGIDPHENISKIMLMMNHGTTTGQDTRYCPFVVD